MSDAIFQLALEVEHVHDLAVHGLPYDMAVLFGQDCVDKGPENAKSFKMKKGKQQQKS